MPNFDKAAAEAAIAKFLNDRLYPGMGYTEMPFVSFDTSGEPGVVAFERPDDSQIRLIRLDELAAAVAIDTSIGVVNISTWTWDGPNGDEDVMIIAFDIPELHAEYRDPDRKVSRNRIRPVSPDTAPSPDDFVVRNRAEEIIEARKTALKGMMAYLPDGDDKDKVADEFWKLTDHGVSADEREFNDAIVALDFDRAAAMLPGEDEPAPGPRL